MRSLCLAQGAEKDRKALPREKQAELLAQDDRCARGDATSLNRRLYGRQRQLPRGTIESIVFISATRRVDDWATLDYAGELRYPPDMERAFGMPIPRSLAEVCNPTDMALLVYDMQVGVVSQVRNGATVVARVQEVLTLARACRMRVFFTRHLSLPRELMGAFQYRMAMSWQHVDSADQVKPWFVRGSPGFELVPELAPLPSEAIFDKITMSAFEGTPLPIALRDCGIRAIALVGLAIEVGIEPTARHAADLGLIPVLIADACGSGNEDAAQRSISSLGFGGDTILTNIDAFGRLLRPR